MNDIPIGKAFIFYDKYYYYDTYINRMLRVTKEQYKEIKKMQKDGVSNYIGKCENTIAREAVLHMIKQGFFKTKFIDSLERKHTNLIEQMVSRCINHIQLQVTRNCNFKCRYCFFANENEMTRVHENKNMSWSVAKKSIDFLYDSSPDTDDICISFYGGEPFLNFDVIKKTVEYAKKKFFFKKLRFSTTTNGSIMNEDIINFLAENNFNLLISLDGPSEIQNNHRRFISNGGNTFDKVLNNIMLLRKTQENYFNKKIMFNPVMFADESYSKVIEFFNSIGISQEFIRKQYANMKGIDYEYDLFSSGIVNMSLYEQYEEYNMDQIDNIKKVYNEHINIEPESLPKGGCIPGIARLFVTVNGDFYPCEKINENVDLSVGDIRNGFNINQVKRIANLQKLTYANCTHCWAVRFCNMCAIHCTDAETGNVSTQARNAFCDVTKKMATSFMEKKAKEIENGQV